MFKKIKTKNINISEILEHIMACIVFICIVVAIAALKDPFIHFIKNRTEPGAFLEFMGMIFSIVIGIEFFKLLCKPGKDTMLEVLMFVIARHMIIEETSAIENFLSIITIGVLFVIDRYLLSSQSEKKNKESSEE